VKALVVACACALGCAPEPTTLLIDVDAIPGVTVESLTLHVGLPGDAGVTAALPASGLPPVLPGRVVVKFADASIDVDLSLDGSDADGLPLHAGRTVHVEPHQQVETSLTLGHIVDGGSDDLTGCDGPCVFASHRVITIQNGSPSALPAGYTVRVELPDAELPPDKVRSDLNDLRIFSDTDGELDRVIDASPPGQNRAVWFALTHPIPAGASDSSYSLYYGDPNAGAPPADPAKVFALWDGFDGAKQASFWNVSGSPTVTGGNLVLHQNGSDGLATTAANDGVPTLSALEWRSRVTNSSSAGQVTPNGTFWYWVGYQHTGDFSPSDPWLIWIQRAGNEEHAERKYSAGASCSAGCAGLPVAQDSNFHWFRIERDPGATRFYRDGVLASTITENNDADWSVMIRDWAVTSDLQVDWIRARMLANPEPTVTLGPEL
jgi:hypothetical protein